MNDQMNVVQEVLDSTECLNENLRYLTKLEKLDIHDLSEILINLDNVWNIISNKF